MRALFVGLSLVMSVACFVGCSSVKTLDVHPAATSTDWRQIVADRLPLYGHRNWIVIADSAYPAQTREGIETVVTGADQIEVVQAVLGALDHTRHVTPTVYTDAELKHVPEKDAPGIEAYRKRLAQVLGNRQVTTIPHEEVILKLDKAGETFKVLILKTNLTLPYTSVFLELGCGYWTADAEKRLRTAIHESGGK